MGLSVPLVMTTLWNFENTGRIARDASRQLRQGRLGRSSVEGRRRERGFWGLVPTPPGLEWAAQP